MTETIQKVLSAYFTISKQTTEALSNAAEIVEDGSIATQDRRQQAFYE